VPRHRWKARTTPPGKAEPLTERPRRYLAAVQSLAFTPTRWSIDATIDGEPLDRALGHPGMCGLDRDEWLVTARTLQGWMPQDLGLEREEWVPDRIPVVPQRGFFAVPCHQVTEVLVTLPGGDRPEVSGDLVDGVIQYDYIPLLSCGCGSGIGCAHHSVTVSFQRTRVLWEHDGLVLTFAKPAYDRAIKELLVLLGESPRLISDEEWQEPVQSRVVRV
jgi:hypothetical protein